MRLEEIAKKCSARLRGDGKIEILGIETLENATSSDLSFLANARYDRSMRTSNAGAIFVSEDVELPNTGNFLIVADPSSAFQQMVDHFCKEMPTGFSGIHETAVIHQEAVVGKDVTIAPYAVIDARVTIGDGTVIGPHVVVGPDATIGSKCHLHAHSIVREGSILEDEVTLQPGAIVGSCGFGYISDDTGQITKLDQRGIAHLKRGVEIGANSTIDRARFKATLVDAYSKIDNLVQIAHNVSIGKANFIAAQTGIAGSTKTGDGCMFGGQAASVGHITIADGTKVAARGALSKSVLDKGTALSGAPAAPIHEHNRTQAHMRRLESYAKRIAALEEKLEKLSLQNAPQ